MSQRSNFHEDLDRAAEPKAGSERGFGLVFAGFFAVIALLPLVGGGAVRWWALGLAAALLGLALGMPAVLGPLNRLWFRFGLLLHKLTNPILMGLIFYFAVTPTALILRLMGKDLLRLRFEPGAESYWIERRPPGPEPETMRNQF